MFLLLALIVQIVQIQGRVYKCNNLGKRNGGYGEDYKSWTSVSSLSECQRKCESSSDWCAGITWVKNSRRNCRLYDYQGTRDGVGTTNQDSYYCLSYPLCEPRPGGVIVCSSSNAHVTTWASSTAGTSDVKTGGGIGDHTLKCPKHHCEALKRPGQCCLTYFEGKGRRKTRKCPKSCD